MFRESTHGLIGCCVYQPHLFDAVIIDQLIQDLQAVLEQMTTQPEHPISAICVSLDKESANLNNGVLRN
jgi:hypothetical protein